METLTELIRWTTSLFAIAVAFAVASALKGAPVFRWAWRWLALVGAVGLVLSHAVRAVPTPALVPAVALAGLVLGFGSLAIPSVVAGYAALEDRHWRVLMAARAVFGALILAAGGVGLFPLAFAIPAGVGDILVGALALVLPGSLAAGGHRGARLLVFGAGIVDLVQVLVLQVTVVVPWLAATNSLGISLLLPWVVVPMLATLNAAGLRLVLKELMAPKAAVA